MTYLAFFPSKSMNNILIKKVTCPNYIVADECFNKVDGQYARFECTRNGWFKNSDLNEWANYSDCFHAMIPVTLKFNN